MTSSNVGKLWIRVIFSFVKCRMCEIEIASNSSLFDQLHREVLSLVPNNKTTHICRHLLLEETSYFDHGGCYYGNNRTILLLFARSVGGGFVVGDVICILNSWGETPTEDAIPRIYPSFDPQQCRLW